MILSLANLHQRTANRDDDALGSFPQISPADALECLYKLRLFEEQQQMLISSLSSIL
jgi:hypothetical protein